MNSQKKSKYYVSDVGAFLKAYDQHHPQLSTSQQREKEKYERLDALRDHVKHD